MKAEAGVSTVTAIVPTFNRQALLVQCLESLLNQTRRPDRILVVDDGSDDGTAEMVGARYAGRVDYLWKENGGKASALNLALTGCDSDFIWICDDDDLAAPEACQALANGLEQNPNADLSYGRYMMMFDQAGGEATYAVPYGWPGPNQPDVFLSILERMFICQFSSMVRRTTYDAVGPFREDLLRSQDYEMLVRIPEAAKARRVRQTSNRSCSISGNTPVCAARGPIASGSAASYEQWRRYDRMFLSDLRRELPPGEFTPAFARSGSAELRSRAAFLQRAVIFGRRGLWDFAVEDWARASALGGDQEPLADEIELAARLPVEEDSLRGLAANAEVIGRFGRSRDGAYGRQLVLALFPPVTWWLWRDLRRLRLARALAMSRLVLGIFGNDIWTGVRSRIAVRPKAVVGARVG